MTQPFKLQIKEGTPTEVLAKEASRLISPIDREKIIKIIATHDKVPIGAVREEISQHENLIKTNGNGSYLAKFDGLVDVVNKDGKSIFLVKEDAELKLKKSVEINGVIYYPPPTESLPFKLLPRAEKVLEYYKKDTNSELYSELLLYHKSISELPCENYYDLIAAWDFLTYLQEEIQYSPYIWFYAIPERGKSRTGKGCIYVAYRGVHVESLRDAYLVRLANNLGATIFFDVMDLSKKAERAGSDDILLARFEKGTVVPRVLYPDRGPHLDTVYFEVFGSTIIATNEPVNPILETRAVMLSMPESIKSYEEEVIPEKALPLKERLVAFRARHLGIATLPDSEKPARGRLGDILKPIIQVIKLVKPGRERAMLELVSQIQAERKEQQSDSYEARLLTAIISLEDEIDDGLLPIQSITDRFNVSVKERFQASTKTIGWRLKSLGFMKRRRNNGMLIEWDEKLIIKLSERFGLKYTKQLPPDNKQKLHKQHDHHPAINGGASCDEDLSVVSSDTTKTTPKLHGQNPNNQEGRENSEDSEVLLQGAGNNEDVYDREEELEESSSNQHSDACDCDTCIPGEET